MGAHSRVIGAIGTAIWGVIKTRSPHCGLVLA